MGTGGITRTLADAARLCGSIEIRGVVSRDPARARRHAAELGASWHATDLDAAVRAADIDAVYIATPNSSHAQQAMAAIEAGRHVLVEKPAVQTSAEWAALVDAARARRVILLEAMRTAYDPGLEAVRALLPEVGRVRRVSLGYSKRSSRYDAHLRGELVPVFDRAHGGGALMDLGVYAAHVLVRLFGEPLHARVSDVGLASGVDGAGLLVAEYDGFVADLSYSKVSTSTRPNEIQGEAGTVAFDHVAAPRELRLLPAVGERRTAPVDEPRHLLAPMLDRFASLILGSAGGDADAAEDQAHTASVLRLIESARCPNRGHV